MEGILCFFLCKVNRRRECVEAARREFSEESLVAPAVTRRRKTVLLRLLVAEKQCSCGYSSQKNSAPAVTRRRKTVLLRLLVAKAFACFHPRAQV
ncbi:hypothetical protein [Evansella halocellulosilytica]|uniref:hypothetical protein n=1 Tax=Evansella halocellulosilytica TaxID=2011013 RepID=UPI001155D3ED|nr:hypothetical protein [Evansella halocellulosilytica]